MKVTFIQRILKRLGRAMVWMAVFFILLAATGVVYQSASTEADQRNFPPPGNLIDVGGFKMHIHCEGQGEPTVILDALSGGYSSYWGWVQPEVAKQVKVCAYDRAGFGWSESDPQTETPERVATNLHTLLTNAGVTGPYILVGHSKGGLYVRQYASLYPEEVAGMVLLDAANPYQFERYPEMLQGDTSLRRWMPLIQALIRMGVGHAYFALGGEVDFAGLPSRQHDEIASAWSSVNYWKSTEASMRAGGEIYKLAQNLGTLGDLPLIVITRGSAVDESWEELQNELAALSTDSLHIIVDGSTHASLVFDREHAHRVSDVILKLVDTVRSGKKLTA